MSPVGKLAESFVGAKRARLSACGAGPPVIHRGHATCQDANAEVEAGPMRMKVPLADILGIEGDVTAAKPSAMAAARAHGISVHTRPSDEPAAEEINVIGCTVEEATRRVDKFLDEAALAGRPAVRIIHGHGTGALRRGLAEFLTSHPLVESIRSEAADRGGEAITIAELED